MTAYAQGGPGASADVDLSLLSLEELGRIEVTIASKTPAMATRTPAAISVLTEEDIRRSGATTLPELLRLVPGVEVAQVNASKWAIGIRGFQSALSRSVLVLIDGRSVYTPLYAGVFWEVQDTLIEDIERIEVIRGPGGTIWGANAVNGVINVVTKDSSDTHGVSASVTGGNVNQGLVGIRYGAGNGTGLDYRVYLKGFGRAAQAHASGEPFDDWRMGQGGFRLDWSPSGPDALTFQGDLYQGEAGESTTISAYASPFLETVRQDARLGGGNLLAGWRRAPGSGAEFQLKVYYDRTRRESANFAERRDTFDADFVYQAPAAGRHTILWGLGMRLSAGDTDEIVPTVAFRPNEHTETLVSGFVRDEIVLVEGELNLAVGSKFLHQSYAGFELQPSAGLIWTPGLTHTVWSAVTRAVRTPSRVEADLEITSFLGASPLTYLRLQGNSDFSSEKLLGYEVGYRGGFREGLAVELAAFLNSYDRLLSLEPGQPFTEDTPPPSHEVVPFLLGNGLRGTTTGIELAADWLARPWWRLKTSYAYLNMALEAREGSLDTSTAASTEGSSPRHSVALRSFVRLPGGIEFDQFYRVVDALPSQGVDAYQEVDARLGRRVGSNLEVSLVGQNLLRPRHPEFSGGSAGVEIRRSVYGRLNFTW